MKCNFDCFNCLYPDCMNDKPPRAEYMRTYYLRYTEEQKQRNRERALAYYRKNRDRINKAKREKRRIANGMQ